MEPNPASSPNGTQTTVWSGLKRSLSAMAMKDTTAWIESADRQCVRDAQDSCSRHSGFPAMIAYLLITRNNKKWSSPETSHALLH